MNNGFTVAHGQSGWVVKHWKNGKVFRTATWQHMENAMKTLERWTKEMESKK